MLLKKSLAAAWNDPDGRDGRCTKLSRLVVHEVGHAFGIGRFPNQHPTNTEHSIMSYRDNAKHCRPQAYDIVAMMTIYQSQ